MSSVTNVVASYRAKRPGMGARVEEERNLRDREAGPRGQHPAPAHAIDDGDERKGEQWREQLPPA
jgi:hypothetical protein